MENRKRFDIGACTNYETLEFSNQFEYYNINPVIIITRWAPKTFCWIPNWNKMNWNEIEFKLVVIRPTTIGQKDLNSKANR